MNSTAEGRLIILLSALFAILPNICNLLISMNGNTRFFEEFKILFCGFKAPKRSSFDGLWWEIQSYMRSSLSFTKSLSIGQKQQSVASMPRRNTSFIRRRSSYITRRSIVDSQTNASQKNLSWNEDFDSSSPKNDKKVSFVAHST